MTERYEPCGGCGAATPAERCIGCLHDFAPSPMTSNANTSGLGDVGLSETYRFAYESIRNGAPGLSDATCAAIARSINMKVSLAANDRATAAEARADRLAEISSKLDAAISWLDYPFIDNRTPEAELRQRVGFMMKDAEPHRAALQQEAQP